MKAPVNEVEAEKFRRLALPALQPLHRLARALTRDRTNADDLVQETYMRALRYFSGYRGENIIAWLATIMRNLHRTGCGNIPPMLSIADILEEPDPCANPEQAVIADREAIRLRQLIDQLPEPMREALIMREFGQLSYDEIAKLQNVPIGTVMSRLARARTCLRESVTL